MPDPGHDAALEDQIDQWREYLRRRQAIHSVDVAELEDHLGEQVAGLVEAGLATDEAFLVAVKRMGDLDALSREFNLTWSAVLSIRFLRGRGPFAAVENWQTDYVPVYAAWATIVVIVFPPLFAYA